MQSVKNERYAKLVTDFESAGWSVDYSHVAFGSVGMFFERVCHSLHRVLKEIRSSPISASSLSAGLCKEMAKTAINCSFTISRWL